MHIIVLLSSALLVLDTCDSEWQSRRDDLTVSAFVSAITSLLTALSFSAVVIKASKLEKTEENLESEVERVCN